MNKLWFVKMRTKDFASQIVYLLTAVDDEAAGLAALDMVNPDYKPDFEVVEITPICDTPDTIDCFEPC